MGGGGGGESMKNASRHVVFSFGWSLGLSASANIRKLSNINSRIFAEAEAEAASSDASEP